MTPNNTPTPPKSAERLLLWFLRAELAEEVMGDLEEKFYRTATHRSVLRAKINYWYQVLNYLRPFAIKKYRSNSKFFIMYQHNFKLSYRTFLKYKSSFIINLIGLASGLACAMLIFLWVADEVSVDKFHEKNEQLYQAFLHHEENGTLRTGPETQGMLAETLENEVPEVLMAVEDTKPEWFTNNFAVSNGKDILKAQGKFSGEGYFKLFSYGFRHGNPEQALRDKSSIVITESLALKIFGTTNGIIGKTVEWHLLHIKKQSRVSGVIKDLPLNSSEQFDFVLPFSIYEDIVGDALMHWGNFNTITYVELEENTDISDVNEKLRSFIKVKSAPTNVTLFLSKFSDNYLYGNYENGVQSGGRITYVKLFSIIAVFVLIIACINFMNLSTARASRRLKEIGVKKTLGAGRFSLITQHMSEAILTTLIALILALGIVYMILPQFNNLTGKQLSLLFTPQLLLSAGGIALFTGFLAGSYPALYLSGFKPINVLKRKLETSFGEIWTRKGLVVFQFALSIIMIVCVLVVYKQMEYIQSKNLGYDKENVLKIPIEGKAVQSMNLFFNKLKNVPGIANATGTTHAIVEGGSYTTGVTWEGKNPDVEIRFEQARVYYNFFETLGIKLLQGRTFSEKYGDENSKIIFNEAAIEAIGIEEPIGKKVIMWGKKKEIIGVVKNFNYATLHQKVEPMLFHFDDNEFLQAALIKIESERVQKSIDNLQSFYKEFNPGHTLEYEFLDQNYQAQYIAEQRVSTLSRYFAGIAIIISCLGLFGLAAFTAERRQKEIGIRKILGAGNLKIVKLLSGGFTKMVITAICLAIPISYWMVKSWLNQFAYRIDLEWWFFALAGIGALFMAWLVVSIHTIKAAKVNPVQCLKDD